MKNRTREELEAEVETLQRRLEEAEETLRAIQNNEVDALIIDGPQGKQVFTLQDADLPYRTLTETMSEGALTVAADGTILYCNSRFAEMLRAPLNKIIGLSFEKIMPCEEWLTFKDLLNSCGREGFRGEYHLAAFEGQEIPAYVSARDLKLQGMEGFCIVVTDLAEQRALERQIYVAQKMEALGTLAGGIAHDFNNILAGIIGFTEMVLEDATPGGPDHKRLELVMKGANRGRDLVKQILAFSRRTLPVRKPLALKQAVEEALNFLRPALPSTIEIVSMDVADDAIVLADPGQMQQVLTNLCTNAAHAMNEKGGILEIVVSIETFAEAMRTKFHDMTPGEYVVLKVRDTGCGMEPRILDQIFDPFFTTKDPGVGTGLGLSVVHSIIEKHDGGVTVESKPGIGTTFKIYLPRIRTHEHRGAREVTLVAGGKERILIVDDEDMLVELNKQRLSRLGYEVVATTSSTDALEHFRKEPDRFDVVITDLTMPVLNGMDLAAELLKIRATIPIILSTGQSEMISPKQAKRNGIKELLMKPITKQELAAAIRRVLDTTTGG